MIGFIKGKVISKRVNFVLVDVSGVGYKVYAGSDTLVKLKKGETAELSTHLVVRENVLDLYGFLNQEDLELFSPCWQFPEPSAISCFSISHRLPKNYGAILILRRAGRMPIPPGVRILFTRSKSQAKVRI